MSLDLYVHTEVNVGVLLPAGHGGVLHRVQIYTVNICRATDRQRTLCEGVSFRFCPLSQQRQRVCGCNLTPAAVEDITSPLQLFPDATSSTSGRINTFDADGHVRIDALPGVLQPDFLNLYGK